MAGIDARIAEALTHLAEASSFEGEFSQRLADAERRISQCATLFAQKDAAILQRANASEYERLVSERTRIENERDSLLKAQTVTGHDSVGKRQTYCSLRTIDVQRRLATLRAVRGNVAAQLQALEAALTPGQMVQSGVEAPDLAQHRQRMNSLRERVGGAA